MKIHKIVVLFIIVMLLCAMILVGCVKKIDDTDPNISTEPPEKNPPANYDEDNFSNDDFKELGFEYEGNKIAIMDFLNDEDIVRILGKAEDIKTHTYSKDDGLNMDQLEGFTEKQYYYPGLVLKTIDTTKEQQFFVFSIDIRSENYETTINIKIGDSFEKLKEAYPKGNLLSGGELTNGEDDYRYEPIDYSSVINFHIKDKKVDSIIMFQLLD